MPQQVGAVIDALRTVLYSAVLFPFMLILLFPIVLIPLFLLFYFACIVRCIGLCHYYQGIKRMEKESRNRRKAESENISLYATLQEPEFKCFTLNS
jgi:predicted membrane protein